MPRRTRKHIVGKKEHWFRRERELGLDALAVRLRREWHWLLVWWEGGMRRE